jgi:hypothetical protein
MKGIRDQGGSRSYCDLSIDSIRRLIFEFIGLKIRSSNLYLSLPVIGDRLIGLICVKRTYHDEMLLLKPPAPASIRC